MTVMYIASPACRWVQGNLWTPSDKGFGGKPLTDRNGQPRTQWFVGVACPKGPEFDAFWGQIVEHAKTEFPQGQWQQPHFAWKLADGDAPEHAAKPGRAGCWILRLASGFAPEVYDANHVQLIDPQMVVKGDWLRVNIGVQGNGDVTPNGKPSVYLNLGATLLVQKGEPIASGPSVGEIFGAPGTAVAVAPAPGVPYAAPVVIAPGVPGMPAPGVPGVPGVPVTVPAGTAPLVPGVPVTVPAAGVPGVPGVPLAAPGVPAAGVPGMPAAGVPGVPGQPAAGFLTPGVPQQ